MRFNKLTTQLDFARSGGGRVRFDPLRAVVSIESLQPLSLAADSTINVDFTSSLISVAGVDLTGSPAYWATGDVSTVSFIARGKTLTARLYGNTSTPLSVSVDGGAATTPTFPATGQFVDVPIFTGLSNGDHAVVMTTPGGPAFFATNTFTLTGSSPSFRLPSGYGVSIPLRTASYIQADKAQELGSDFGLAGIYGRGGDAGFRFKTTGGTSPHTVSLAHIKPGTITYALGNFCVGPTGDIWVYCGRQGYKWLVTVDGVEQSPLAANPAISTFGWERAFMGLDATAVDATATFPARRSIWFNGDSITDTYLSSDTRIGHAHLVGKDLNVSVNSHGTPGAVCPTVCQLIAGAVLPDDVFLLWGTNDVLGGTSQATYTANVQSLLVAVRTRIPLARIYIMQILPIGGRVLDVTTYNGYIATAVSNVGDGNTEIVSVPPTFDYAIHTTDGAHPNAAGYRLIADQCIAALAS